MFVLINTIITYALTFIGVQIGVLLLGSIYSFATLLPTIAVTIRRMHDVGKSGWFMLIPIYNLVLTLTEGNSGPNEYGPDPKGNGEIDLVDHIN